MRVVLVSTYDLGRQPFGLASPAAWLADDGHTVRCLDLAVEPLDRDAIAAADVVAFHVPMHTATRLTLDLIATVRASNPGARLAAFGLYAAGNAERLRSLGVSGVFGGEFEAALAAWIAAGASVSEVRVDLDRLAFRVPRRDGLPPLDRYARLELPDGSHRIAGATEASRGCKHQCRHCPVVPVYGGRFRVVPADIVLEDVRRMVERGAEHVTFGDPDFWNGIGHAMPLVRRLHAEHPTLTYDVTIKIEHLLKHHDRLSELVTTGCRLVTSAVESLDDAVLERLDKGHTRADVRVAAEACRAHDLALQPTFIPFTPWTTADSYRDLLDTLAEWGLDGHVAPIQLAIRLLVPAGSRLLELPDLRALVDPFDDRALVYPWRHPDPDVDRLQQDVFAIAGDGARAGVHRLAVFDQIRERAGGSAAGRAPAAAGFRRAPIPYLTEPWYC